MVILPSEAKDLKPGTQVAVDQEYINRLPLDYRSGAIGYLKGLGIGNNTVYIVESIQPHPADPSTGREGYTTVEITINGSKVSVPITYFKINP